MAEETQRPSDIITISDGENDARVVRSAYEKVWSERGWNIVDEDAPRAQAPARGGTGTEEQDAPKDAPSQTARNAQESKKS